MAKNPITKNPITAHIFFFLIINHIRKAIIVTGTIISIVYLVKPPIIAKRIESNPRYALSLLNKSTIKYADISPNKEERTSLFIYEHKNTNCGRKAIPDIRRIELFLNSSSESNLIILKIKKIISTP